MVTKDIINAVLALSPMDKEELIQRLKMSLCPMMEDKARGLYDRMMRAAALALDVDEIQEDRRRVNALGRKMVAWSLLQEKLTQEQVGQLMGKDRTTIRWEKNNFEGMLRLPDVFQAEMKIFNRFQKLLQNETHRGTDSDPLAMGGQL